MVQIEEILNITYRKMLLDGFYGFFFIFLCDSNCTLG